MLDDKTREARLLLAYSGDTMQAAGRAAEALGSESALLEAGADLLETVGLAKSVRDRILGSRAAKLHRCHEDDLRRLGGRTLVFGEPDFPPSLLTIPSPPAALYVRGRLPEKDRPVAAVIGSRRCTPEGDRFAEGIARDLARGGVAVASGLARGIDSAALRGCIRAGGQPLGVLGTGLDFVYPPENVDLFRETAESGALITEFPLGIGPRKEHFPRRNRLISGLSRGVLVVEASDRSGTLITVDHAIDQDRLVMAVPGAVMQRRFKGTNRLIRDGAHVVLDAEDVFATLGLPSPSARMKTADSARLSGMEAMVLRECRDLSRTPDSIAFGVDLEVGVVLEVLARLESRGIVRRYAGSRFLAVKET